MDKEARRIALNLVDTDVYRLAPPFWMSRRLLYAALQ